MPGKRSLHPRYAGCPVLKRKYSASYRAAFRRQWSALVAAVGPLDTVSLLRLDASRIRTLAVELERASDKLATAQGQRERPQGARAPQEVDPGSSHR